MEMVLVYDGLKDMAASLGMTVEQFEAHRAECEKIDPVQEKLSHYRYHENYCSDRMCTFWDTVDKEYISIYGAKHCEQWKKEHAGEWCTNF